MSEQINHFYEFGPFRLVPGERQLMRDGQLLALSPKAFDTLVMLVQRSGHAVKKDDLIEMLWPDAVVEENNLNQYVSALRKVLNDGQPEERYIETVRRYGYRFTASVRETRDEPNAVLIHKHSRTRFAVKEEQFEEVAVIGSRESRESGKRAGRLALGGAVVVALVAAVVTLGGYLQSSTADRAVSPNPYSIANSPARPDYLAGRAAWNKRTSVGLFKSVEHYERAIEKDPQFALAYAALADSYAFDRVNWPRAEQLARKALDIDPSLAEPHATIGFIRTFWEWNSKDGEREFKQSIKLNEKYATAHQWYATYLALTGRQVEALVEMSRALELEPQSPVMLADMGQLLYFNHRYDEALAACRKAISIDPGFINAHEYLAEIYMAKGQLDEALHEFVILDTIEGAARLPMDKDKLTQAIRVGGLRGFSKAMLSVRSSNHYEMARYFARLGEEETAIQQLELASEQRDFRVVFAAADPIFEPFKADQRFGRIMTRLGLV